MADQAEVRVGLVGVGGIAGYVHYPGIGTAPGARVVAIADPNKELLARRKAEWGDVRAFDEPTDLIQHEDIDAVIVATPNFMHAPLSIEAARSGKHVLCEKPLALDLPEAQRMLEAVQATPVRHMTAFTYRFVPAMRYLKHLTDRGDLGEIRHFRAQRFQQFTDFSVGWRQWRETAGTGELGDMASHRIDYGRYLLGEITAVCGAFKQFELRDRDESGNPVKPSDTDDWVAFIGEFENGVTGVWESTKLATGHGFGGTSHDFVELNGTAGSAIFQLKHPYQLLVAKKGGSFEDLAVPREFLKSEGSLRPAGEGDPATVWRYDQAVELVEAIREGRDCEPSFRDGVKCQAVMAAVLQAIEERRWVSVPEV